MKRNKRKYWGKTGGFLICAVILVTVIGSRVNVSGDSDDPLITLSYLNQRLAEVQTSETVVQSEQGTTGMNVVECKSGQQLIGASGTEIILRSGEATAIASTNGGLSDVTDGKDIGQGVEIEANHLLYIPRSDGRGVQAKTDTTFIVRGTYQIKK